MSRIILLLIVLFLASAQVLAEDLALNGFNDRFALVRNSEGRVTVIKSKKAITRFTIKPFIEQIKSDLLNEQESFHSLSNYEKEAEVDEFLMDLGLDPYMKGGQGAEEAQRIKESILNVKTINVEKSFAELNKTNFWKEFETKLNEAFLFVDPTVMANLDDARFFYKRQVTYKVVEWALQQARKRFSSLPILNIASYVIVRVHDMMMDQRHFNHNMLLHYFEIIPETKLGMTKEEVDRAVSSIYEYRIGAMNILESNRAANDWLNYGMNSFYVQVRSGNAKMKSWASPMSGVRFEEMKKLNFAFAEVKEAGAMKIYHLHHNAHQFSKKPSLAYDYSNPMKVRRNRSLLNIAGVALGFVQMPSWLKSSVVNFIESFYVAQVRMEGALIGHFENTNNVEMMNRIYKQRSNFYIVQ